MNVPNLLYSGENVIGVEDNDYWTFVISPLKGDAYVLTDQDLVKIIETVGQNVDQEPTEDSLNLVTSGGVKDALNEKAATSWVTEQLNEKAATSWVTEQLEILNNAKMDVFDELVETEIYTDESFTTSFDTTSTLLRKTVDTSEMSDSVSNYLSFMGKCYISLTSGVGRIRFRINYTDGTSNYNYCSNVYAGETKEVDVTTVPASGKEIESMSFIINAVNNTTVVGSFYNITICGIGLSSTTLYIENMIEEKINEAISVVINTEY